MCAHHDAGLIPVTATRRRGPARSVLLNVSWSGAAQYLLPTTGEVLGDMAMTLQGGGVGGQGWGRGENGLGAVKGAGW